MSESKRVKVSSVAAFMFLPQFHLSFKGFAHIVPVFIRTVAMVFAAAGLIPNNHPATRYGVEGVRRYGFTELVGEAWFNLRRTNATGQQWGLFIAVLMMIGAVISAFGAFILTVFFNLGAVAHAQIFTYPQDINGHEAYGGQGDQTDLTALESLPSAAGTTMFDMRIDPASASQDYALMVLDKVLRQSAVGTGGAMQNALATMMEVYNTGIMIVAAVMIFWMILSIVVDTAKSGIVGGGRHNMVWTPIRVVFALGIMIPLGATGFSSGQFAVMKLAEWGSNFGSRLWAVYVSGVIDNASLMAASQPSRVGHVVTGLAKAMTCQVAYNSAVRQVMGWAEGVFTDGPVIRAYENYDASKQTTTYSYTNDSDDNLCGAVTFAGKGTLVTFMEDALDTGVTSFVSGIGDLASGNPLLGSNLSDALLGYQEEFRTRVSPLVDEDSDNRPDTGGAVLMDMRRLACAVAATVFTEDSGGNNAAAGTVPCDDLGTNACGDNGAGLPDHSCVETAITRLKDAMVAADTAGRGPLETWINDELEPQMSQHGWGGMGSWFMYIQAINDIIIASQSLTISVQPGKLWANVMQPGMLGQAARGAMQYGTVVGLTGAVNFSTTPEANQKTFIAMQRFDAWWDGMVQEASVNGSLDVRQMSAEIKSPGKALDDDGDGFLSAIKDMASDPWAAVEFVFSYMFPGDIMIFSIDTTADSYPLAQMVKMGGLIQNIGLTVIIVNTILALIPTVNYGSSTLSSLLGVVGKGLFLGGVMLGIYLPILPLLRVALAVLTWITSVFEAVIMVPIAALAHLSSEGEGLAGGARTAWILWLNVLLRPALVVCGFVGAMLIFNAFAVFFHASFMHGVELARAQMGVSRWLVSIFTYSIVYVFTLYTAANTTFKLLDLIPNAMMRWIGGTPDQSFDSDNDGYAFAATQMITNVGGRAPGNLAGRAELKDDGTRMGFRESWKHGWNQMRNNKAAD